MQVCKTFFLPCAFALGLAGTGVANAQNPFSSMQLNGNATLEGNALQFTNGLEQAGTAFVKTPIALTYSTGFVSSFQFSAQVLQGALQADGVAFVIQNDPTGDLAQSYDGSCLDICTLSNTVALEFLSYTNNQVALYVNGQQTSVGFELGSQTDVVDVTIAYAQIIKTLIFSAFNEKTGVLIEHSFPIDLQATLGPSAYIGFSGASGGTASLQTINNWQFYYIP
jgi:hypothetical protein